ncbi:MAG TPA: MogA/MoaB family molybdenum cofactor biosynthesis protein [Tepidisphaeraceae bacterium]|nr:MogA/MoaB family molybdenum cofactor biosynthesis protein [Tepidisphaeraceae bacterium]
MSDHHASAKSITARVAVVTLSDTRTRDTDTSGQRIRDLLTADGHAIAAYHLIRDNPDQLSTLLTTLLANPDVDAVVTNGGTGIAARDFTLAAVDRAVATPLPGFGEIFRMLSYDQVGAAAILSRATAGISAPNASPDGRRKPIFALPGSTKAVDLGVTKLVLPELRHILWELQK